MRPIKPAVPHWDLILSPGVSQPQWWLSSNSPGLCLGLGGVGWDGMGTVLRSLPGVPMSDGDTQPWAEGTEPAPSLPQPAQVLPSQSDFQLWPSPGMQEWQSTRHSPPCCSGFQLGGMLGLGEHPSLGESVGSAPLTPPRTLALETWWVVWGGGAGADAGGSSAVPLTGVGWETSPISLCAHPRALGQRDCLILPGPASSSGGGRGCDCQGCVLQGWDTPGQAGCARQHPPPPPSLLAVLGSLVHTQPPTAVKMFFSPAGRSQPTHSPTRDIAPICRCLLGRRGHPGSPPPPLPPVGFVHTPAAPSPPAYGVPPCQDSPSPAQHGAEQRAAANLR